MSSNTILIVLLVAVILFLLVRLMGKKSSNTAQNEAQTKADAPQPQVAATASNEIQGEVLAAIFMALEESKRAGRNILTFKHANREYSPWNSKIYNMRELPRR